MGEGQDYELPLQALGAESYDNFMYIKYIRNLSLISNGIASHKFLNIYDKFFDDFVLLICADIIFTYWKPDN